MSRSALAKQRAAICERGPETLLSAPFSSRKGALSSSYCSSLHVVEVGSVLHMLLSHRGL